MTPLLNRIKVILSDKHTSIVIIALAIVVRVIQLIFFYNIRVDGMYQVMAMQNFVDGHGISIGKVLPTDLSTIVYEPLINWPPGYSLLLSPFYILFGHDYIAAGIALDILSAIILILTCRSILKTLNTPAYLVNLFTLLTGFFIYYFYFINSSDAIAIAFLLLAVHFTLLLLNKKAFSLKLTLGISTCLFLCGLIKYLFIPVVFVIPLFLLFKGMADKNRAIKAGGTLSFTILLVLLGAVLAWQKINSGSIGYISESTRGFFPENLLETYPALPASFISPDTISLAFPSGSEVMTIIFRILQCLHVLLFLAVAVYILKKIINQGFKKLTAQDSFFYLSFFLSAGITLVLIILSMTVGKEENIPGSWWTYVEEPRYYGLIHVLVHLGVFLLYQYYRARDSKRLKYLLIILILLLLPETFRGILFTARRVMNAENEEYSWHAEKDVQLFARSVIQKEKGEKENVIVTGSSYYMYYRVGMYNHVPALTDAASVNDLTKLNTKKSILLLVLLQEEDAKQYESFRMNPETQFAGEMQGVYFYTVHVKPR